MKNLRKINKENMKKSQKPKENFRKKKLPKIKEKDIFY